MWPIGKRVLLLVLLLAAWSLAAYLLLVLMMNLYIEPVRGIASSEPEFSHHGKPVLNSAGIILWAQVLAIYGAACAFSAHKFFRLSLAARIVLGVLVTLTSAAHVTVVHPTLLLAAMGLEDWRTYVHFVASRIPALDQIYGHWGLPRLKYHVLAGQAALTTVICLAVVALTRWRARAAT